MPAALHATSGTHIIEIANGVTLTGDLIIPANAKGLVIFAHGSGSSRLSRRNQRVAARLHDGALATLLFDLLTIAEDVIDERSAELRFDIPLLAERLVQVTAWAQAQPATAPLPVGYFGSNTGAAAALVAAAIRPERVHAVVSRGGRPDLAGPYLPHVKAPTLLIVGGNDAPVIGMNQTALERLSATPKELVIVPGASHLFEEPGALHRVAALALRWFERYLGDAPSLSAAASS